jgi:hypothetical protein
LQTDEILKDVLSQESLTQQEKLLILLSLNAKQPKKNGEICALGLIYGINDICSWNLTSILTRAKGKAIKTPSGWEITISGEKYISRYIELDTPLLTATTLRSHLSTIKNQETATFIEEAILCFEHRLYRSAVVLSWVGAVSLLYDYTFTNKLSEFNAEAKRRDNKWKDIKIVDDFSRMKESDFLDVLESISILGKNIKQELKNRLILRNSCGHPNSLKISDHTVAAHIEILIDNVFSKFQ